MTIVQNPRQFKVPDWMLNRKKDNKDGKFSQVVSNSLDMKLRDDLERLKKIRAHRGLRHYCARLSDCDCDAVFPREHEPTTSCAACLSMHISQCGLCSCSPQGASVCVVSAPRPPVARVVPSVCPRRRVRLPIGIGGEPGTVGHQVSYVWDNGRAMQVDVWLPLQHVASGLCLPLCAFRVCSRHANFFHRHGIVVNCREETIQSSYRTCGHGPTTLPTP